MEIFAAAGRETNRISVFPEERERLCCHVTLCNEIPLRRFSVRHWLLSVNSESGDGRRNALRHVGSKVASQWERNETLNAAARC